MTENEAIEELQTAIELAKMCTQNLERKREIQGYEMAIKALKEVQQYRTIGTPEECRVAVEKQTAKRPRIMGNAMICPSCPRCFKSDNFTYCPSCGQKLKWEDEE